MGARLRMPNRRVVITKRATIQNVITEIVVTEVVILKARTAVYSQYIDFYAKKKQKEMEMRSLKRKKNIKKKETAVSLYTFSHVHLSLWLDFRFA